MGKCLGVSIIASFIRKQKHCIELFWGEGDRIFNQEAIAFWLGDHFCYLKITKNLNCEKNSSLIKNGICFK
jgi:hypothetical protein